MTVFKLESHMNYSLNKYFYPHNPNFHVEHGGFHVEKETDNSPTLTSFCGQLFVQATTITKVNRFQNSNYSSSQNAGG
jgi:hypothetical protein